MTYGFGIEQTKHFPQNLITKKSGSALVSPDRPDIETNVVDVYIRHLRTKLPGDMNAYIETVRGVGYVMRE